MFKFNFVASSGEDSCYEETESKSCISHHENDNKRCKMIMPHFDLLMSSIIFPYKIPPQLKSFLY